jgi:addiction module RelE/StbE family toxin
VSRRGTVARPAVVWTPQALGDVEEIGACIERDDAVAAARWIDKLLTAAQAAADAPLAGRRVPELERDDVRERIVGNYRLVYWLRDERLEVLTVFEGHRLPPIRLPAQRRR